MSRHPACGHAHVRPTLGHGREAPRDNRQVVGIFGFELTSCRSLPLFFFFGFRCRFCMHQDSRDRGQGAVVATEMIFERSVSPGRSSQARKHAACGPGCGCVLRTTSSKAARRPQVRCRMPVIEPAASRRWEVRRELGGGSALPSPNARPQDVACSDSAPRC